MAHFLLDTNTCIEIVRGRRESIAARIQQVGFGELSICSNVWAELLVGAHLSNRGFDRVRAGLESFLRLPQFPFDQSAAEHYAEIRAHLQPLGQLIGERDMQIAAIARSRGLTLITHNTKELSRVPSLQIEDWEQA
jgi:tRNA(fMet)-specific endonuclease VapC